MKRKLVLTALIISGLGVSFAFVRYDLPSQSSPTIATITETGPAKFITAKGDVQAKGKMGTPFAFGPPYGNPATSPAGNPAWNAPQPPPEAGGLGGLMDLLFGLCGGMLTPEAPAAPAPARAMPAPPPPAPMMPAYAMPAPMMPAVSGPWGQQTGYFYDSSAAKHYWWHENMGRGAWYDDQGNTGWWYRNNLGGFYHDASGDGGWWSYY